MILPCEIAVKSVIPAIKATIAKELVETHGLKQEQAAEILGVTQSAVSKYTRQVRGHVIKTDNVENMQPLIDDMIKLLIDGSQKRNEFLALFCQMCIMIRENGLMCSFCQKTDPKIRLEDCSFCLTYNPTSK